MSSLIINGITCPIRLESLRRARDEFGANRRAIDGTMLVNRRATKRRFAFSVARVSHQEAQAWEALVRGEPHVWSFEASLYSSKGAGPSAGYTATRETTGGKYGSGFLRIPDATTFVLAGCIPVGAGGTALAWSVALWRMEGGVYVHYVVTSDGRKWKDGVRNDAVATAFLSVGAAGAVTVTGAVGSTDFDDLVIWPVQLPSTWPPLLHATGRAFPEAPKLEVYGDLVQGSSASNPIQMKGQAGEIQPGPARLGGALDSLSAEVPLTLSEG